MPPEDAASTASTSVSTGPVGSGEYQVKQGECLASIADKAGFLWPAIWDDPGNQVLKETRKDPNVLLPGDLVHIPPVRHRNEAGQTEQRHRFRLKGEPCRLKLTIEQLGQARANESFRLVAGDQCQSGSLDDSGTLDVIIPAGAQRATIFLGTPPSEERLELAVGSLDPVTEITGVQARLENLGYDCGGVDGTFDDETRAAISAFQQDNQLNVTGDLDPSTLQVLLQTHWTD
jgi:hypothetical protein